MRKLPRLPKSGLPHQRKGLCLLNCSLTEIPSTPGGGRGLRPFLCPSPHNNVPGGRGRQSSPLPHGGGRPKPPAFLVQAETDPLFPSPAAHTRYKPTPAPLKGKRSRWGRRPTGDRPSPHGRVSLAPRPDAHSSRCPTPPRAPPPPAGTDLLAAASAELTIASARARPGTSGGTDRKSTLSGKRRPKAEKDSTWSDGERAPAAAAGGGRGAEPAGMAVQAAHLEADAFLVCLNHALSTEKEEVMGLCIGEVDTSRIVHIHSVIILRRSDKRKDRVEISPEQLSAASTEAERLAELTGRPMRVVGWYHSHPHITVWPSHVDVRTQAMYQMMDQGFVGLIFSCFIEDKNTKTGRVLYTCFQSIQAQKSSEYERIEIPIHVIPHNTIGKVCLESAVELPKILCQEEQDAYRKIHSLTHLDSITKIHNGSVFTKNLCSQMSAISGPLLQWLEDRLEQNKQRMHELQREKEELLEELAALE
uniref:BRCA1/BRCA2-containing complex subunit 3 n=1 Tax=Laticauda laticaudata TaxID=8630 RepID=A0A8C5SIP6_LATLA